MLSVAFLTFYAESRHAVIMLCAFMLNVMLPTR